MRSIISSGGNVLAAGFVEGLSKGLGIIMLIGFVYGVIKIIGGAANYSKDPDGSKQSIVAGLMIAGAVALMTILFSAFGLDLGGLTPDTDGL
jgi:hypothetical protein